MLEKPKATKKKSPTTTARPAKAAVPAKPNSRSKVATPKSPQRKPAFYVIPSRAATVSNEKPTNSPDSREFSTFAEARRAAIDELVLAIEAAELQLSELKRATRCEELSANGKSK